MPTFYDTPINPTNAGLQFNYAVWTANSTVTLTNVPWDDAYRNIVKFDSTDALISYLHRDDVAKIKLESVVYAKPGMPVRIPITFNQAYKYNYLHVHNPAIPHSNDEPRDFFYFIQDVKFIAPNTTELVLQLDIWSSFFEQIQFKWAYVERGHLGIANKNQYNDNGREYLTVPEGLDLGNEYVLLEDNNFDLSYSTVKAVGAIIVTTVSLSEDPGSVGEPKLKSANGSTIGRLVNGYEVYYCEDQYKLAQFLQNLSGYPWISQGIISITLCPALNLSRLSSTKWSGVYGVDDPGYSAQPKSRSINNPMVKIQNSIPDRYKHLQKFLTYPYCHIEMTSFTGKPVVLKPELLPITHDGKLWVDVVNNPFPPAPRALAYVKGYANKHGKIFGDARHYASPGLDLDIATGYFNLPQTGVTNNSYLSFMASNVNSIAFQHQAADWSYQKQLSGAKNAFDNSRLSINAANESAGINIAQNIANRDFSNQMSYRKGLQNYGNAAVNGINSALHGDFAGGIIGGAQGMVNAALDHVNNVMEHNARTAISNDGIRAQAMVQSRTQSHIADNNLAYARFAANGDYQNAIGEINAKVQDAKLLQPTTSGQIGGDGFIPYMFQKFIVAFRSMVLSQGAYAAIGEFWLRYGYAINRFHYMRDITLMSKFTYWKVKELDISASNCPEVYKTAIRGIFEKGVTVWTQPNYIGNTDVGDNGVAKAVTIGG